MMHVGLHLLWGHLGLRLLCRVLRLTGGLLLLGDRVFQDAKSSGDLCVLRSELCSASICVDSIRILGTAFIQGTQVVPNFGDIGIEADSTGISIHGVAKLIHLIIQYTDGAPEGGISSISIHGLLVSIICLTILSESHEDSAQQIPGLTIRRVEFCRQLEEANSLVRIFIVLVL